MKDEMTCEIYEKEKADHLKFKLLIFDKLKDISKITKERGNDTKSLKNAVEENKILLDKAIKKIDSRSNTISNLKLVIMILVIVFGYLIYNLTTKIDENVVIARKVTNIESKDKKRRLEDL